MSFFDRWKHFLTSIMNCLDVLLTRKMLGCEQIIYNMNDWSWKIQSTVKSAYFIIKTISRVYFWSPQHFWGAQGTIGRPYYQEKWGSLTIVTRFLFVFLLSACFSPFQAWSLYIFDISIFILFFILRMIFSISWSLCSVLQL